MKTTRLHIDALSARGSITAYSPLIERAALERIIRELTAALRPCGARVAEAEVRRLAACYPTFRPLAAWRAQMEDALKEAPCDLIRKACRRLAETETFPPNKAQLKRAVADLIAVRVAVLRRAEAMLAEHDRRAAVRAEEALQRRERAAFRAKLNGRSPLEALRAEREE